MGLLERAAAWDRTPTRRPGNASGRGRPLAGPDQMGHALQGDGLAASRHFWPPISVRCDLDRTLPHPRRRRGNGQGASMLESNGRTPCVRRSSTRPPARDPPWISLPGRAVCRTESMPGSTLVSAPATTWRTSPRTRRRVAQWLGVSPDRLLTPYQIHSADVATVFRPVRRRAPESRRHRHRHSRSRDRCGNGRLRPGPLRRRGSRGRGCGPCGWKGALGGVLEATIEAMEGFGARRDRNRRDARSVHQPGVLRGWSGVRDRFKAADAANARYFTPSARPAMRCSIQRLFG